MNQLKKLLEERPDEKVMFSTPLIPKLSLISQPNIQTLVVSQWTGCLTLVSDYLTESGILHVKSVPYPHPMSMRSPLFLVGIRAT